MTRRALRWAPSVLIAIAALALPVWVAHQLQMNGANGFILGMAFGYIGGHVAWAVRP